VPGFSGPSTTPDFVVGLVILALTLLGQSRTRPWAADRNSPLPLIVLALGLLVYFGYRSTAGPLSAQQEDYLYVTLVLGVVFGALRARTMMLWRDTAGLCVRGTPGTLVLWVVTGLGMGLYYAAGNITYAGFVLYLGVTFVAQQAFVIVRGVRAGHALGSPATAATGAGGEAANRSADEERAAPADHGTVTS
jgi:hypothetical protein